MSGIMIGWLTHFYMLSHKLTNWDDINSLSSFGSGDYLGRWFLKFIHPLGSRHSIPAVHGFLLIVMLSLSACIILDILQLKSTTAAVLVPAVMITFPSVVSVMTFMFMAHTSGIAIFMACLAVWLIRKNKWGALPAMILLICALGTYQPIITIAITLMLMSMMSDLIRGKDFKEVFKTGIIYVAVLGIGVLIYMKICHIVNPNLENETYGGVANMGNIPLAMMPRLIGRCYKRFLEYFLWKPFAFVTSTARMVNKVICILAVVLFALTVWNRKIYKDVCAFLLLILVCALIPLAAAFIYFMAPEADYSMLMVYAYSFIYVIVLALLEYCMEDWEKIRKVYANMIVIVTVCTILLNCYTDYLLANKAYLRTEIATERVKSYFNRVITTVQNQEGYMAGDKIIILGEFYYKDNPSSVEIDIFDSEDLRLLSGLALENGLITSGVRYQFIRTFLGEELADLSWEEKQEIMETDEYREMPLYPQNGCVQRIDGVWVVKMCNNS
ncbi:MAG: glucosyltransferase domain-containing protein [Lachnospiraceae bacterium]|nr:glucosyltransferase domain-containing protein [Lachnospiraceae bacterium]